MHVAIGGQNFIILPVMILFASFFGGMMFETFIDPEEVGIDQTVLMLQMGILMTGMILGGFAFMAPEIAEKRFGDVKLLVASQPYLPIEVRRIYFLIYVKDILFYSGLILAPISAGLFASEPLSNFTAEGIAFMTFSAFLTFTLGFSMAFAISMAYIRSPALGGTLVGSMGAYAALLLLSDQSVGYVVPSIGLNLLRYEDASASEYFAMAMLSVSGILAFSAMAIAMSREKYESREHTAESLLPQKADGFPLAGGASLLVAKEYLDLRRSGGVGKILFTFIMPIGALMLVRVLSDNLEGNLDFGPEFYAMIMGFFGMLIYYTISGSDYLASYQVLPLSPAQVIYAKLRLHFLLSLVVSTVMAATIAVLFSDRFNFLYSLAVALPIVLMGALFMGIVVAYLTGFRTAEMLLEAKFLAAFVALGAFPLSLSAALVGVLGRDQDQLVITIITVLVAYILVGTYFFYVRIEERWSRTTFLPK